MKKHKLIASMAIVPMIALGAGLANAHDFSWAREAGGAVPDGAIKFGNERNGEALFVCRAEHAGGVHMGKIRAEFGGCNIPYGGKEIVKTTYEVLVHR